MEKMLQFLFGICMFQVNFVTAADYNITSYGAVADGHTVCTAAIQAAIDESSKQGGRVVIPAGNFVTGTLFLKENTGILLEKNACLLGSTDLADYPQTKVDFRFYGDTWVDRSLIIAHHVNNITIEGQGIIDGRGSAFPVKTTVKPDRYRNRPYLLWVAGCKNVCIRDIELRNSAMWMQSYIRCENLRIEGIKVYNHSNKNNDLMDIDGCKDVVITGVVGDADDDGITFKSTSDRISENIVVSDCVISSHCNAIKFGTETTAGFRNITISNCVIRKSAHTTALTGFPEGICGLALEMVDGGIMENVVISNISIDGPRVPIFIRLGNRARKHFDEAPEPSVGKMRNILLSNIIAKASSPVGCSISGIPEGKIEGVSLTNIRFFCPGNVSDDFSGKRVEELPELYPESTMFGLLPAFGLYVRHANHIYLQGLSFELQAADSRPAIVCDDVQEGSIRDISVYGAKGSGTVKTLKNSTVSILPLQAQTPEADELLKAINECIDYASNVLLDDDGKSRCDYNTIDGKWYPYEEPWHTGQLILGLLEGYKVSGNKRALAAAKRAGDWWINLEIKDNPRFKGMVAATHGDVIGNDCIVFATTSDGLPGVYELSRVTGDMKYAKVAVSSSRWLLENMYYPEKGVCYDLVDLKTGEVVKENSPFYKDKESQTLEDVSRPNTEGSPFKDAYEFTHERKFKDAHILLCNSLIEKQDKDGIWMRYMPNHQEDASFHPRFNLWYAESLLEAYELTKDRKYLEAAAITARTYMKAQKKDGTIYYVNYTDGKPSDKGSICGSAVAFAGIVWIRLAGYGYPEFLPAVERSVHWILNNRYAVDHSDPNLRSGVVNTRMRMKNGSIWLTHRDVGTSFGLRFLSAYYQLKYNNTQK
ncbi:MAG: hypothetical protein LBR97_08900 [Dysgonamonadaceae bacterium]|jgi:hypothetical protein|nr:hypothetical protein [Dysgonamonadaceae bacterium]